MAAATARPRTQINAHFAVTVEAQKQRRGVPRNELRGQESSNQQHTRHREILKLVVFSVANGDCVNMKCSHPGFGTVLLSKVRSFSGAYWKQVRIFEGI